MDLSISLPLAGLLYGDITLVPVGRAGPEALMFARYEFFAAPAAFVTAPAAVAIEFSTATPRFFSALTRATVSSALAPAAVAAVAEPRSDHRGSSDYKRQIISTFVTRILTSIANPTKKAA